MSALLLASVLAAHAATLLSGTDFEADDGGCVAGGETAQWAWGAVTGGSGSAFDGSKAWALNLAGGYLNDATDTLSCPAVDVTGAVRPVIQFEEWYDLDVGDYGSLEIGDGTTWSPVAAVYTGPETTFTGSSGGWRAASVDLTGWTGPVALRWVMAADVSGVGGGWFVDDLTYWDGDPVAPAILALTSLGDTDAVDVAREVDATVRDDVALQSVTLRYALDSADPVDVPMSHASGDGYTAEIPGEGPGTTVTWEVLATDGTNVTTSSPQTFRYFLEAPTNLRLDEPRAIGPTVPLTWDPPTTPHVVDGYQVSEGGVVVARSTRTGAQVPVTGGDDVFTVAAVYGEGAGDASEPLTVTASIPAVNGLTPAEGWPGDHLHVALTGVSLLMVEGAVTATLGDGVSVGVSVRDVDNAVLDVQIADAAAPGARDLVLTTSVGNTTVAGAFTVLDGTDRPQLVAADLTVRQGEKARLAIGYVGTMATTSPTVALGDGIVVDAVSVGAGTLQVDVTVAGDAALGDRTVTVDDGVRVFGGVTLTVKNSTTQGTGHTCSTAPGDAGVGLGILAAVLAFRRRGHSSKR